MQNIERITLGDKEIIFVGTAHVSKKSEDLVKKTIEKEKPDVVAVELDKTRYAALKDEHRWKNSDIGTIIREGKTHLLLLNLFMSNYQRKIGDQLGVKPGAEMIAAIETAKEKKIKVALIDRNIQITLKRAMNHMSFLEKTKILFGLLVNTFSGEIDEKTVEELKKEDVLTEVINELAKQAPATKKVLIDERDSFMANKLIHMDAKKVVAVVGAGHVKGIIEKIKKPHVHTVSLNALEKTRKRTNILTYIKWGIPALFLILLGYGFFVTGVGLTFEMLKWWFLINGVLAGLGTLIALGHPLSVIAAFIAAPFTSLNPLLAAGWVAGYVEAIVRKPKVKDFESLNKLNSIKDYWKNQVTRILLVVIFANVGSMMGTLVALPYLFRLLQIA